LCIITKDDFGGVTPQYQRLVANHAYYVRRCDTDNSGKVIKLAIVNPHDGKYTVDLYPVDFQFIKAICILDPIPIQ
jgi:hypothetical protein